MRQVIFTLVIFSLHCSQVFAQSEDAAPFFQTQSNLERMRAIFEALKYKPVDSLCRPKFDEIKKYFLEETFVDSHDTSTLTDDDLISPYAFRKEIKKTFTTLVLGNDDASKVRRYASLDVSEKPAFSFSPFNYESDPEKHTYNHIVGLTFSGKLTDASVFKLKDFRDLKAGLYWVYLLEKTNYKPIRSAAQLRDEYICNLRPDVEKVIGDYTDKFKSLCAQGCLDDAAKKSKYESLGDQFIEEVTDVEIAAADNYWASKNFFWIKPELLFGMDKVSYLSEDSLDINSYHPIDKKFFTATLKMAGNYFHQRGRDKGSVLYSVWGSLNRKHTFSEVLTPDDFQMYHAVNDTINQLMKNNEVFVTDRSQIESGMELDFGARIVRMFALPKDYLVGVSLSFSRKGLVAEGDFPSLFTTEAGLVFPFLKPDGKSTFNLEIFYKNDVYSNYPADNDRFLGFRFNVPITN